MKTTEATPSAHDTPLAMRAAGASVATPCTSSAPSTRVYSVASVIAASRAHWLPLPLPQATSSQVTTRMGKPTMSTVTSWLTSPATWEAYCGYSRMAADRMSPQVASVATSVM